MPVGAEASQWVTVAAERTLLAIARTVTSTARVLDAVQLLRDDPRVQVVFAFNDSSPFRDGVPELLRRAGAKIVPWEQLAELDFDAALTASENTELRTIDAPTLVLQHGAGFHKSLPDSRGDGRRVTGTVRADDLTGRRVLVAVTHPQQAAQLAAAEPAAAGRTVLIADPMLDRLRAARLLRQRYRAALGLGDRRLVVVTSTWGRQSLFGRWPELPARLLAELDADAYRVATVLHPNVTGGHGGLQVRMWLAAARDAGLLMIPPDEGWQATLAAADCVVGDHSSVSLLAAGADVPLLLAPLGDEVIPGTPMTTLSRLAARLDPRRSPAEQVEATIAGHVPGRYAPAVDATFAGPPAARPLRTVLYQLLDLPEPPEPAPLPVWPPPIPDTVPVASHVIHTKTEDKLIWVRRYPAAVRRHVAEPVDGWIGHLHAGDDEWDLRTLQAAEVLTRAAVTGRSAARSWAEETLARFPGAAVAGAGVAGGAVAVFRDGRRAEIAGSADVAGLVAALYTLARAGSLGDGRWHLRVAGTDHPVAVHLVHGI
ncbi:hypothetical protein [Actinoplanes sp. L3-i22]|uniref:hypothetical protein n=1 Tax=Actinoplanes sp. L3-i22 TaxID=2836373 RepID=UPI001C77279F|nr:hypothetical protein [Actinoplanes sp. L3-i22]BCY08177.1 hypothetical protein L3i22_032650 [Actinoplanes sp. L3-i22]